MCVRNASSSVSSANAHLLPFPHGAVLKASSFQHINFIHGPSSILHMARPFLRPPPHSSVLPVSLVFSRLGGASSSFYHCEPTWPRDVYHEQNNAPQASFDYVHVVPPSNTLPSYKGGLGSCPTASCPYPHPMACQAPNHSTPSPAELLPPIDLATQPASHLLQRLKPPGALPLVEPASLLLEDSLTSPPNPDYSFAEDCFLEARSPSPCPPRSSGRPDPVSRQPLLHRSSGSRELRQRAGWPQHGSPNFPQAAKKVQCYRPTGSPDNDSIDHWQPSTPPRKPKSWIKALSNDESVEEAVPAPFVPPVPVLTSSQQMTTVTSPSKPRLVTISPRGESSRKLSSQPITPLSTSQALVSAFSPDTPPETPHVADRSDKVSGPTRQNVTEQRLASLHGKISYPFTPPNSRIPTPFDDFDKITQSASTCLQEHSCWGTPTMTQLDPSTAWILQELELLLADFPLTALRLQSPVIKRLRAQTSGVSMADPSAGNPCSTAPYSRYSPYRPLASHPMSPQLLLPRDQSWGATFPPPVAQADPTSIALRTIFPQARPHHLDSIQATYVALQFVVNLPSSGFAVASPSDATASPPTTSVKHSRSSSIASSIPRKARAMLGLDSPVRSPSPLASPAVSWYRASSPELDLDVKARLENVELLLETSVRRLLVEIEGRPLGKADDALIRAVGEVIKMGERMNVTSRS